jgi:hypothetical protein
MQTFNSFAELAAANGVSAYGASTHNNISDLLSNADNYAQNSVVNGTPPVAGGQTPQQGYDEQSRAKREDELRKRMKAKPSKPNIGEDTEQPATFDQAVKDSVTDRNF